MITAASAIANNGVLVQPRIVKSIENPDTGAVNCSLFWNGNKIC